MNIVQNNLLIDDHSELDKLFEDVFAELQRNCLGAFTALDYFWARLAMHIRAEHLHLFPAIIGTASANDEERTRTAPSIISLIERLRDDHSFFMSELTAVVKTIRFILDSEDGGSPLEFDVNLTERLDKIRGRLNTHNKIEEACVYPLVELYFSRDEAIEIRRRMKMELDNVPSRFARVSCPS